MQSKTYNITESVFSFLDKKKKMSFWNTPTTLTFFNNQVDQALIYDSQYSLPSQGKDYMLTIKPAGWRGSLPGNEFFTLKSIYRVI